MSFHIEQRCRDRGRGNGKGCRGIGRAAEIWTDADTGAKADNRDTLNGRAAEACRCRSRSIGGYKTSTWFNWVAFGGMGLDCVEVSWVGMGWSSMQSETQKQYSIPVTI